MLPAIIAADKIFVVTTPDRVTLHTSVKAAMLAKKNKANIEGVIINKIRDSKYEIDLKEIESLMDLPVVARVKDHKKLLEAGFHKIPITVYDSLNEISREVKHLAGAIAGEKEVRSLFDRIFRKNHWGREMVNREFMRKNFYEPQIG
jgi:MinD-like ATPase involved in chromosome partitioning or flagellar assembly